MKCLWSVCSISFVLLFSVGCGNGGKIAFSNQEPTTSTSKPSSFTYIDASQALVIEDTQTIATGYHGKLQMNSLKGQTMTGPGGYKATIKFTARNR